MFVQDLKKQFAKAKQEPLNCAVGLLDDGSAELMLSKTRAARALVGDLEKEHGKLRGPGFGTARIDPDIDPKLIVLTLNKAAGGLGRKLKKSLRGSGVTKVEIRLEDGSIVESVGADEEDQAAGSAAPAAADEADLPEAAPQNPAAELSILLKQAIAAIAADPARGETLKPLAAAAVAAVKAQDGAGAAQAVSALEQALTTTPATAALPPAAVTPPDLRALKTELTALVPQFAANENDPDRLGQLRKLAIEVVNALKGGQADAASSGIAAIKSLLAEASAPEGAGSATPLGLWRDAKSQVDTAIAALQDACRGFDAEDDEELGPLLQDVADKGLHGVTDRASVGMMAAMLDVSSSPKARAAALQAIADIEAFLQTTTAEAIDGNPFGIAVRLRQTLGGAVQTIKTQLAA